MSNTEFGLFQKIKNLPWAHIGLAFIIMCVNKLGVNVSGGEEQYIAFARHAYDPSWIPNSFAFSEFPGTRIVFQWLVGPIVAALSFESAAFVLRFINFLILAFPVGLFFKRMQFSVPFMLVIFQVFVLSEQNLLGGEWMIKSFEPKSVAYIFVFFALYWFPEKPRNAAISLAVSAYFHVLVGGWIALIMGLYLLWKNWKQALAFGLWFVGLLLPFVIYLLPGYFGHEALNTEHNLDWVYVYYRLPHHLGIWRDLEYFLRVHLDGVLLSSVAFVAGWLWRHHIREQLRPLNAVMMIALSINFVFVGIAAMDHYFFENSGGFGLKFYPFRSNSIAMFLLIVIALDLAYHRLKTLSFSRWVMTSAVVVIIALGVIQGVNNVKRSIAFVEHDPDYRALCAHIRENTDPSSVVMLLDPYWGDKDYNSFNRRAERENFIVPKFVSAERVKLLEWYERNLDYMAIRKDINHIFEVKDRYGITHFVSADEREQSGLTKIHSVGKYRLYRVDSK